jgi:cellulose synthase/poly-beta-1,6-N-acetylglucosamine synthase-like glycosyltransferase/ribosomal protein S18 acetylase RimI-like enzyme
MFMLPVSMSIDLITLAYSKIRSGVNSVCGKKCCQDNSSQNKSVSVLVPAYNEGEKLRSTVDCILRQTYHAKDIYILDDISTDGTQNVCREIGRKNKNVIHIRRDEKLGKAGSINKLVEERAGELGDYVLVVDGDVKLEKNCLEELVKSSQDAAIVTGYGYTRQPASYVSKMLYEGESWINSVFSFRKRAQNMRNGIFVICGALSLYEKKVLKETPIPERTMTEDTDYTWLLQEKGYKINYEKKARAVGNNPDTLKGYWKRYNRWFSGTFQGLYMHGRELNKSKPLLYSTLLPGIIETIPYSVAFSSLPIIAAVNTDVALGMLTADLALSAPFLFFHPKGFWHALNHLPDIYAYKYFGSVGCMYAGIKTTWEKILGKEHKWKNNWVNSSRAEIITNTLGKRYLKKNLSSFYYLEKEWEALGEERWERRNYLYRLPKKWKLSSYAQIRGKTTGYAIVSQPDKKKKEAYLHKILVDRDYQGLGIGNRLLQDVKEKCRRKGIEKIIFKVRTDNDSAIGLYKKNNVRFIDKEISKDGIERYLCEWDI